MRPLESPFVGLESGWPAQVWVGEGPHHDLDRHITHHLLRGKLIFPLVVWLAICIVQIRHQVAAPPVDEGDAVQEKRAEDC